jgi:hypothetical protein
MERKWPVAPVSSIALEGMVGGEGPKLEDRGSCATAALFGLLGFSLAVVEPGKGVPLGQTGTAITGWAWSVMGGVGFSGRFQTMRVRLPRIRLQPPIMLRSVASSQWPGRRARHVLLLWGFSWGIAMRPWLQQYWGLVLMLGVGGWGALSLVEALLARLVMLASWA